MAEHQPDSPSEKELLPGCRGSVSRQPLAVSSFRVYHSCRDLPCPRWYLSWRSPHSVTERGSGIKVQPFQPGVRQLWPTILTFLPPGIHHCYPSSPFSASADGCMGDSLQPSEGKGTNPSLAWGWITLKWPWKTVIRRNSPSGWTSRSCPWPSTLCWKRSGLRLKWT